MKNKRLKILLSAPRGFCAGVERAIEIVEKSIQKFGSPVYVRHEIVHNKYVVDDLKNKGAIRLTVAKYYLPSGKSISEVGVRPDIEVNEEGDNFKIKTDTDNQLNYAIKLLNG